MADHCRTCGAPVFMLTHETTGKKAPIDMEPIDGGNVVIDLDVQEYAIVKGERGKLRYRSHFASCPDAKEHRKK